MLHKLRTVGAAASLYMLPLAAMAQTIPTPPSNITDICSILQLVARMATWFGILVFIIAVIAILYAGFLFLTSGGNEETTKKARSVLLWGLVGIAVALLASNAIPFVQATVGGGTFGACVATP